MDSFWHLTSTTSTVALADHSTTDGLTMHLMPISCLLKASALAISLAATGFAHAGFFSDAPDDPNHGDRFINRKAEGWFWYEVEPEPIEPVAEEKEEPKIVISEQSKPQETKPSEPADQGPAPLSTAWLRDNLPRYLDMAIDNPTIENVRAYLYLQRLVRDRAQQFSDAWEMAMVGDPLLDEINRRPVSTFANRQIDLEAHNSQTETLRAISKKAGIFFFFSSDCETCELQAPIVEAIKRNGGFALVSISIDGKALRSGLLPDYKKDTGQARRLGIASLPAIVLVSPDGRYEVIGQGPMSMPDVQTRILIVSKRNGWISEDEFDKTRPILNTNLDITSINVEESKTRTDSVPDAESANGLIPPAKIVEIFRDSQNGNL